MSDPAQAAAQAKAPAPARTEQAVIRNFCIIAHIDHGKSTLADRMLQLTGIVDARQMRAQYLDRMDIERERGITIKSQAVRLPWKKDGTHYVLNMIDTPGHVDFTYEVSRSLAACEGAVLLVDAAQGIEAQTLANLYLAINADLKIIPVLNKIDLPAAQPERYAEELSAIIGCDPSEVLRVSAKTGEGVEELLNAIVDLVPHPAGDPDAPARALIFDSVYDTYRGVVTYVRVVDGRLTKRERMLMMSTQSVHETLELGVISPEPIPSDGLAAGEVGYVISGVKDVRQARVGDTITTSTGGAKEPLAGYDHPKPMVFSGLYPVDGDEYPELREALDKLQLNDAALVYEPETSTALGFGFRCGFLGLLHMEIVRERLEREFDLSPHLHRAERRLPRRHGERPRAHGDQPERLPRRHRRLRCGRRRAPRATPAARSRTSTSPSSGPRSSPRPTTSARSWSSARAAAACCGAWSTCPPSGWRSATRCRSARSSSTSSTTSSRAPAATRASTTSPTASRSADLVKVDILLQGQPVDAFSQIVHADNAREYGLAMTAQAQGADPAAAVRGPDPGGGGVARHRPREHPRPAQGRPGQVLRRRHHPQAQAAREAEGGQEADEDDRPRRGPPGGFRRRALHHADRVPPEVNSNLTSERTVGSSGPFG